MRSKNKKEGQEEEKEKKKKEEKSENMGVIYVETLLSILEITNFIFTFFFLCWPEIYIFIKELTTTYIKGEVLKLFYWVEQYLIVANTIGDL